MNRSIDINQPVDKTKWIIEFLHLHTMGTVEVFCNTDCQDPVARFECLIHMTSSRPIRIDTFVCVDARANLFMCTYIHVGLATLLSNSILT